MAAQLDLSGSVSASPATGTVSFPSQVRTMLLNVRRTYDREFGGQLAVSGSDASPQALPVGSIVNVRFLALRASGGEVRLRVTTPDGATQVIPVTGLFVLDNPNSGSEVTAVSLAATGAGVEVEYVVMGGAS